MTAAVDDVVAGAQAHRAELLAYCYRMTGSMHDAEDLVQEIQVRAWRAAESFDPQRASLRTWLYRIATNVCLTALKTAQRRAMPVDLSQPNPVYGPELLDKSPEIPWLEPFPDALLGEGDPAAVVTVRESVRLAFVAALQHLPPLQRSVLILRDVLALKATEVAELLDTSTAAVNSALQRAHAQLSGLESGPAELSDAEQREFLKRYVAAFEAMDVEALKLILREDVLLQMPPFLAWFHGRAAVAAFMTRIFGRGGAFRLVSTRANGRPAVAAYRRSAGGEVFEAANLHVLTLDADGVARMDLFHAPELFRIFGLPAWL
ncbi:sigma-70 family RNA polymerase sigma factor [Nocardia sp. CDC153]|uniref:sigma-70 family RNA polymerase sigma factor n=1 Tax=Nocardia sp. CDC153 TaxID=3112167 RepID=UPI002DC00089|nr:sigma-70 family RNA polymerase sigma factor [Nocardia sp. CDC153]MEC3952323.1 sigma-70 family RNA polymerase sigma factor [Nocardia sp. CDC153]